MGLITSGKTINQLDKITTVTGLELIPLAVADETGAYRTYSITLDNFLQLVNQRITNIDNKVDINSYTISAVANTAYSGILEVNNKAEQNAYNLITTKSELNSELNKANTYISYNTSAIVRMDSDLHNIAYHQSETSSYVTVITYALNELSAYTSNLSSYTHTEFTNNLITDFNQEKQIQENKELDITQQSYIDSFSYLHNNPWETMNDTNDKILLI